MADQSKRKSEVSSAVGVELGVDAINTVSDSRDAPLNDEHNHSTGVSDYETENENENGKKTKTESENNGESKDKSKDQGKDRGDTGASNNENGEKDKSEGETNEDGRTKTHATSKSRENSLHAQQNTLAQIEDIISKGDEPVTTQKEIRAWYIYDWANSPFAGVAIALLIPILMSELAEQYGCEQTKYGCDIDYNDIETGTTVQVWVGAWELKPTSYAAAFLGLSALFQAFFYLMFASLADFASYRQLGFRITAFAGGIACCIYIVFGEPILWQVSGWFTIIVVIFHGLSMVFYNSYLPILVESHSGVITAVKNGASHNQIRELQEMLTDHLSLVGFAIGYLGAICVMIICLGILFLEPAAYYETEFYGDSSIFSSITVLDEDWASKVNGVNLWYTSPSSNDTIDTGFFNAIQLIYDDIDGNIYGNSDNSTSAVKHSISFEDGDRCDKIRLYLDSSDSHITGIQFHLSKSNGYTNTIGTNDSSLTTETSIIPSKEDDDYDGFILAGYEVERGTINTNSYNGYGIGELKFLFMTEEGLFKGDNNSLYERVGLFVNGFWWIIFTIWTVKYLKNRPGPPLPNGQSSLTFGFRHTWHTLKRASAFPELFKYLGAYFLFSDGIGTFLSCGVLFGREVLNMSSFQLAILVLEVYIIATLGNYLFLKFQMMKKLEGKSMLTFHIIFMAVLPLYATIGLIDGSPIGLQSIPEMYIFSVFMGINLGSIQSYARAVFAQLTPVGHEAEMFGLYEITDRGSSWIGPIVVAAVSDYADMRWALFYVFLFFALPLPIIMRINMKKGRDEAGRTPEQVARRASLLSESAERRELQRLGIIPPPSAQPELDDVKEENSAYARKRTFESESDRELPRAHSGDNNNTNNNGDNGNNSDKSTKLENNNNKSGQFLNVNGPSHGHDASNGSISNLSELDGIVDDMADTQQSNDASTDAHAGTATTDNNQDTMDAIQANGVDTSKNDDNV